MTNGKWLLLIFFIALIVLTFFIMKEYNNQPPSDKEGYSSMCEDIIVNDKTTVNGKTFTPPERGSTDMASYMKFLTSVGIVPMEKTTVNPMTKIGNYVDGADRRIPELITGDRTTPEQCAQLAKDRGFKIAGIQWQGECWGGNDIGRALSYNNSQFHNPSNPADFAYGRPWNNLVMTDTTTKSCSVNQYSEYISGLLENNITSYAQLKTINNIEPFVGGPNPPPPGSSPIVSSDFDSVSKSITIPKFGLLKQDVQALVNEVNKSNTNINVFLNNIRDILYGTPNIESSSADVVMLRKKLDNIGYSETGNGIIGGGLMLKKLGVTKSQLEKPDFEEPYCRLAKDGQNPKPGDFNKIYDFAIYMTVSDGADSEFTIKKLATILVDNKITVDDLPNLMNRLKEFYTPSNNPKLFTNLVYDAEYYDKYVSKPKELINNIQHMKTDLQKYNVPSYNEYVNIKTILETTTVDYPTNELIKEFHKYYTVTDANWFNLRSQGAQMQLRTAVETFIDYLKTNAMDYNTEVNLNELIKNSNNQNVLVEDIVKTSLGKRSVQGFLNSIVYETFSEGFQEGNQNKTPGYNRLTRALSKMGVRNINKIKVSPNSKEMTEKEFISYLISKFPGIKDETSRILLMEWLANLGLVHTDIDSTFKLFQDMKISSYQEMMDLKKLMDKVGVRKMSDIKDFLSAMTNFGVSSKQLNEFMEQLNRFGVSLATDRSNAYKFLDLLKRYDITYMKGEYDPCLPKFTIFILNLTSDNITFPMYKFTVVPLLKMLNNGVEPTKPPANPDEKRKLNKNMRDLIIRREKAIYTGGDLYQAEYSYTRCNNNQFPDLKNNPPEDGFKKDMAVYKATAEGKAGTAPPFLHELDKTGKEEPSVKLNNDHTKIPNNYKVSPQIIDKRLFYATTLLGNNQDLPELKPLKRNEQPINFKKIVANLTPYEYAQFKTGKPNLIVPSVMSRLYAKLVSEAKTLRREGEYGRYNSMLDLINYIRILPYYAFRLIAREISSKPSEYDNINSPEYRDFISGVKPFFPENSNIDLSRYAETVDGVMVANMGKGPGMALDQKGAQNQRKTRARGFWRPVVY